jgi:hypothetical protein
MSEHTAEIRCTACGKDALVLREPTYEGFTKVGEMFTCAGCGHRYASKEEVPYKTQRKARVFTEADRSVDIELFEEGEADRLCRYCVYYVVNPFMQWCGHHKKEVEATDTCPSFERKPLVEEGDGEEEAKPVVF